MRVHCMIRAHRHGTCIRRGPHSVLESAGFRLLKSADPSRCPTRAKDAPRRSKTNSRQQRQEAQAVLGGEWEFLPADNARAPFRPAFVADPQGRWHPACYRNHSGDILPRGRPCGEREALWSVSVSEGGLDTAAHEPAKLTKPKSRRRVRVERRSTRTASKI